MAKPTAWSYSRYSMWSQCPRRYKYKFIDKLPEEKSDAMLAGIDVHERLANVLMGQPAKPLNVVHKKTRDMVDALRKLKEEGAMLTVEQQWAFRKDWSPAQWFGKDAWVRSILDVAVNYMDGTMEVIDWKYGKIGSGSYTDQMEIFAISAFSRFPGIRAIYTRIHSAKTGDEKFGEFGDYETALLKEKWHANAIDVLSDEEFVPRPSDKCRWCPWSASAGGPCEFG